MENYQGDLADVVRSIRNQVFQTSSFGDVSPPPTWQLPENGGFFNDPFSRNPLPHELDVKGGCFFNTPFSLDQINDGLLEENVGLDLDKEEITSSSSSRTCGGGGVFTRMLQIPSDAQISSIVDGAAAGEGSITCNNGGGVQISSPRSSGVKRRKSQVKKVVCIPAPGPASSRPSSGEVVPSDLWAWRKYGQKPIKGSPYPSRGYYRCSSSKGCSARKQVERSRSDPNMLVITYTSEHNHPWPTQRNALAGSTRAQPPKTCAPCKSPPPSSHHNNNTDFYCHEASPILSRSPAPPFSSNQHEETTKTQPGSSSGAPMETDEGDHDFFADLDEIETDPLSGHGFGDFESLGIFDWTVGATCSFGDEEEEEEGNLKSGL